MANGNTSKKTPEQNEGKVVTKYDLKKKRREEEARRAKRNALISRIIGAVLLAVIVVAIAVSAFSRYYRINKEYIVVNGESVSEVEFDLYYGVAKSNIVNTYGSYLSYIYGYSTSTSDKLQNFSDDQTWYDYFGSMAVETIKGFKALLAIADERNFEYTTYEDDLAEFKSDLQSAAENNSLTFDEYLKQNFGSVVTEKKLDKYLYDYLRANAVREVLTEELAATDSEIESYYSQNKDNYDTVDYRSLDIAATDASDSTALAAAYSKAEEMLGKLTDENSFIQLCTEYAEDADSYKNDSSLSLTSDYSMSSSDDELDAWLFDSSRQTGDKEIFEDSENGIYVVTFFVSRANGLEDNRDDISDTVLSTKYQEYIEKYTDDMTVNVKNRITLSE